MGDIKESVNVMEQNVEYIELKTRVNVVSNYVKSVKYPDVGMICLILGIEYKEEE